jgi:flagellar hook-associated protein 3 FlgL
MINQTEQMTYRLSNLDIQQQRVSYQMSTKEVLDEGSDNSVLYARVIHIDDKVRTFEGIKDQIERSTVQNEAADTTMASIKDILETKVKKALILANTSTTSQEGRSAIAVSMAGFRENLLQLANTQVEGEYVFAGSDASIKPFEKDAVTGKVTYVGDNKLRKIAVEEGSYREKGITGFDMMMYPSSAAYKGGTLTFQTTNRIIDQDGNEWKLNSPTNNTLVKYDLDGNITTETITPVTNDGATPPTYSATMPSTDGTKFEAKTNIFDFLDETINALNKVDSAGNLITEDAARQIIGDGVDEMIKVYDSVDVSHARLGARNSVFEVSLERVSSKLTQYDALSQEIGAADLAKVAMEAKSLELTYTALYSTISKMNQLSLVNFIN